MKKNKQEKFIEDAINKMFEIAENELRYKDIIKLPKTSRWFSDNTMTTEQSKEFENWFLKEIVKRRVSSKTRAYKKYLWFNLQWGLKINDGKE